MSGIESFPAAGRGDIPAFAIVCLSTYMLMYMYGHIASSEVQPLLALLAQTPPYALPKAVPQMPLALLEQGAGSMRRTRAHEVWRLMWRRCTDPRLNIYKYYGGRGITVCDEWRDFAVFHADMGDEDKLTLDRIDNNGPYSKANCRWATTLEQAQNKRNTVLLTHDGKTQTLTQWASEIGIGRGTLRIRRQHGRTPETGLFAPLYQRFIKHQP